MDKNSKTDKTEARADSISEKRRKLLKTAASTAPVIATLQSGAAFANTSAYQCINDAKGNAPSEVVTDPTSDNWVRRTINRYQYIRTSDNTVSEWWYDVDGNYATNGPYYRVESDGTVSSYTFGSDWTELNSETVSVIVYYEPNLDYTGVSEVGVYPKYYVATPYDTNLPINGSCLASMA